MTKQIGIGLMLNGFEATWKAQRNKSHVKTDVLFAVLTFLGIASVISSAKKLRVLAAAAYMSVALVQMIMPYKWPKTYSDHRTAIVVGVRLVRMVGVVFTVTADLSDGLQRQQWREIGDGWHPRALLLYSGVLGCWLQVFGCPLPFRLAAPMHALHVGLHAAVWLREGVAALASSKLLRLLLPVKDTLAMASLLLVLLVDPVMVASSVTGSPHSSACLVLPLELTLIIMVSGVAPMYVLWCNEAHNKISFLRAFVLQHQQQLQEAGSSSWGNSQLQEELQEADIHVPTSLALQLLGGLFVDGTGWWPSTVRLLWRLLVLAGLSVLVYLVAAYVVEAVLLPRGLAGSETWCPVPHGLLLGG